MAIEKRNFTVSPGRNTIVLRRCSPGGSFGSMSLKPIYGQSYSLALQYPQGAVPAQLGSQFDNGDGDDDLNETEPNIVDLKTVENADPPILWVNALATLQVDVTPGFPEDGKKSAKFGFSGAFHIQAGTPFIKPKPKLVELEDFYHSNRVGGGIIEQGTVDGSYSEGVVVFSRGYVWDIELDKESPGSAVIVSGISGVVDPDDPLKYRYVMPILASSTPEWAPGGLPRAYKYKLGDFMEGVIRINPSGGGGGGSQSQVCSAGVE